MGGTLKRHSETLKNPLIECIFEYEVCEERNNF